MSNRFSRPESTNGSRPPETDATVAPAPAGIEVTITPYRDGPLVVRGPVAFRDQDGNEITVNRKVVALCRCGKSRIKPLCDGTHKLAGFRAPSGLDRLTERDPQRADA
jgi:CDGSH-type Zn-finger protein